MKCSGCQRETGEFKPACKECSEQLIKERCEKCDWYLHDDDGVKIGPFEYGIDYCTLCHSNIDEMTKDDCDFIDGHITPRIPFNCACCNDTKFEGVSEVEACSTCGKVVCLHCYDCDDEQCDRCRGKIK